MSSIAQDNIQKNNTTKTNVVTNNNNIIFNLTSIIETCKKNNANFINQPLQILNMETPSLYVCQKEWATVRKNSSNAIRYLGSSAATTCVLLFLYTNNAFSSSHLDGIDCVNLTLEKQLQSVIKKNDDDEGKGGGRNSNNENKVDAITIHISMVGGFIGDGITEGKEISEAIIHKLNEYKQHNSSIQLKFDVCMVCNENVCENEKYKGKLKPRYGSAVYDSVKGILKPCRWDDLYNTTPEYVFRSASLYTEDHEAIELYDYENNCIYLNQRRYYSINLNYINQILNSNISDEKLLLNTSTSPYAETDQFIPHLKTTFRFFKNNPYYDEYYLKMNGKRSYQLLKEDDYEDQTSSTTSSSSSSTGNTSKKPSTIKCKWTWKRL